MSGWSLFFGAIGVVVITGLMFALAIGFALAMSWLEKRP